MSNIIIHIVLMELFLAYSSFQLANAMGLCFFKFLSKDLFFSLNSILKVDFRYKTFFWKEKPDDKTIHSWITFRKQRIVCLLYFCAYFEVVIKKYKIPKTYMNATTQKPRENLLLMFKLCLLLWQKTFLWTTHFQGLLFEKRFFFQKKTILCSARMWFSCSF